MRSAVRLSLIGLSSWLLACTSPLSPVEALELRQAERRWAARPFQSYTYEYSSSCGFCWIGFPQPLRVSVHNGQVVGVVVVATDSALSPQEWTHFATVEGLFARIVSYAHDDLPADLIVEFDRQWGYPTLIGTRSNIPDVGGAEYIRNLVPEAPCAFC